MIGEASNGGGISLLKDTLDKIKGQKRDREKSLEKRVSPKKNDLRVTEFRDEDDWILSMILVAIMHVNPGATAEEAAIIGKGWVRKLHQPRSMAIWRHQIDRIGRSGIRAVASKIRRELFKVL